MSDLLDLADGLVERAGSDEQVEVVVVHALDTEIKVFDGEIESLSSAESQGVGVRVVRDGRQGFAYAGTFDDATLLDALAEARDNATFGTFDEWVGLAEPDGVTPADLALYDDTFVGYPTDQKVALALELERATRAADVRVSGVEAAEYVDSLDSFAIVSTSGVRAEARETSCYVMSSALATAEGETQTGFGWSLARTPAGLDVGKAAVDAAERATRMLGATKPSTERLTVVLDPWVTAQLLGIIGYTLSGDAVLKGRSLFADRLGEEVASPLVTLVDDPTDPEAFTAVAVDGEGLATRRNELIRDGVLTRFAHNAYTARRAGTASTGSAVRGGYKSTPGVGCMALSLVPGTATQDELVAAVGDGLLVGDVAGLHSGVNPVSGDFSTGAEGLRISGGSLGEPLREFTIGSTLQRMLRDVDAVGGDLEWLPMSAAGVSLVIRDVTVSGV